MTPTPNAVRVFAVEDDLIHQENLIVTLDELGYQLVGLETQAEEALPKVQAARPDVVLLDIRLAGQQTGIDLGNQINQQLTTPIIYVTSFTDAATFRQASRSHPYAYLPKPVAPISLQSSIELALQHAQRPEPPPQQWESDLLFRDCFFVKVGPRLVKLRPEDVQWIAVSGNRYCEVVTAERRAHVRATLAEIQQKLAPSPLIRVHRSYLINLHFLESIHEPQQTLEVAGHVIPLGKTYRGSLMQRLRRL
jgi:two-component system, LytTR family, response regulator LytT